MALSIAAIEREPCADEQDVQVAVVIEVEEGAAVADGLKDIQRALPGNRPAVVEPRAEANLAEGDSARESAMGGAARPRWARGGFGQGRTAVGDDAVTAR